MALHAEERIKLADPLLERLDAVGELVEGGSATASTERGYPLSC